MSARDVVTLDAAVGVDVTDSPVTAMALGELDPWVELEALVTLFVARLTNISHTDDNQNIRTGVISSDNMLSVYGND